MQSLSQERTSQEPASSPWPMFLAADRGVVSRDEDETRTALRQAEMVIRAQEERIRALESLATTDELTGLVNRRGFIAAFERELSLAQRDSDRSGVLVMVDLDGFKSINDSFGHQAGDVYLRAVALVLKEGVRASDTVARLGGDEFAVLLAGIDEETGATRLAKLEKMFHSRSTVWNGRVLPLRASFGLASYDGAYGADIVIQSADVRLYAHKARNRKLVAL